MKTKIRMFAFRVYAHECECAVEVGVRLSGHIRKHSYYKD